jgi:hypothetical protein
MNPHLVHASNDINGVCVTRPTAATEREHLNYTKRPSIVLIPKLNARVAQHTHTQAAAARRAPLRSSLYLCNYGAHCWTAPANSRRERAVWRPEPFSSLSPCRRPTNSPGRPTPPAKTAKCSLRVSKLWRPPQLTRRGGRALGAPACKLRGRRTQAAW